MTVDLGQAQRGWMGWISGWGLGWGHPRVVVGDQMGAHMGDVGSTGARTRLLDRAPIGFGAVSHDEVVFIKWDIEMEGAQRGDLSILCG